MPFIIFGTRGVTSHLDSGTFYCPSCQDTVDYRLKQQRPFFTLFFIPVFPIGGGQRYVECGRCGQTFREAVLDMEPPNESQRMLTQLYQELRTGSSLGTVQKKLVALGMDQEKARSIVEQMADKDTWVCSGCGERYLKGVKKCLQCGA